ncbi:MAG: transcriptional regulator, partial [Betaproteobacteria bacterium]
MNIGLSTETNLQNQLAQHLQRLRKQQKLSRQELEKISPVPAPTIKK